MDERSAAAARLGAVNCVINRGGTLYGANTDGAGFLASLARAAGFEPTGKRCLLIGAGGAARAVALALAGAGAASVTVVNRTPSKAADVAALAGSVGHVGDAEHVGEALVGEAELVVNATPVGMQGSGAAGAEWLIPPALLRPGQVVADLVYVPRPTPWLAAAAAAGATDGRRVGDAGAPSGGAAGAVDRRTGPGRRHVAGGDLRRLKGSLPGVHGRGFGASRGSRPQLGEAQVHDRLFA